MEVHFFKPDIDEDDIQAVVETLRSGWLTSGPQVIQFEREFAEAVRARHAVAVNSCTAALHLAVEALGLKRGQGVLVPAMTFAATAEVVCYKGAVPILIDCDARTGNLDLADAERVLNRSRTLPPGIPRGVEIVGMILVHVGGNMIDTAAAARLAAQYGIWVIEDAAHAFPAALRDETGAGWRQCGEDTSAVTCFSFYANKTITTGEGGMAVTSRPEIADRMRLMSLHGMSGDGWARHTNRGSWDYKIIAPGFKYNLTDIAAALGRQQLRRAEAMRLKREETALHYLEALKDLPELSLPPVSPDRIQSWHLFPIRLNLEASSIDRDQFVSELRGAGVGCSVHWRPLHLHPYYQEAFGWRPEHLPTASLEWGRLISLPIFPGIRPEQIEYVEGAVRTICASNRQGDCASARRRSAV
ncbi:MAG TPA: DegT/DnrJ/EryC1/StrS family aminotransferase [Blastocatellia bacterium]|nr:DegT/DnrJ/EryC1/StrS family aminotransferase [Blastocatellia bacterium]